MFKDLIDKIHCHIHHRIDPPHSPWHSTPGCHPLLPFRPCPGHWNRLAPHSSLQATETGKLSMPSMAIMPPSCAPIMFIALLTKTYLSHETKKNGYYFPLYTGCFIGILTLVYYNPHITGVVFHRNPKKSLTTSGFWWKVSPTSWHLRPAWIFVASKLTRRSPAEQKCRRIDQDWSSHYGVGRKWWEKYICIVRIK